MSIFSRHYVSFVASALLILAVLGCAGLDDVSVSGWEQKLAGKKLSRSQSSGSFSDTYNYWFCSSGEYIFKKDTLGTSYGGAGDASYTGQDVRRGRWSVTSSTLTLEPDGDSAQTAELSQGSDPNVIKFGGTPFQVTPSNECD